MNLKVELTINDIIKANETCSMQPFCNEKECPYGIYERSKCIKKLCEETVDLINRQNAEIERLNNLCNEQNAEIKRLIEVKNRLFYNLKLVCEEKEMVGDTE